MFRVAILALLASAASASTILPSGDVAASSDLGQKLLSKATVVEHARHLDQERDVTFIANYSLRYISCSSLVQVAPEGNDENGIFYTQHMVRFALCPTTSCSSCAGGGEYVMDMGEFVNLYTEAKLNEQEYQCEQIRENCYCQDVDDDEMCENQCYVNEGMQVCIDYEDNENGEEFEIQRYLECEEIEGGNDNNNNNNNNNWNNGDAYYGNYYVGAYCNPKDGKSINLGVFYDQGCTAKADDEVYASRNYQQELPFANEPIVTSECISCKQVDEDNNNNNQNNQNGYYEEELEVTELCQQTYEMAARCEAKMDVSSKDISGCDYINNILPRLEAASRSLGVGGGSSKAAKAFAFIFAATTALFAAYAYFLFRKIKRGSVKLADQE